MTSCQRSIVIMSLSVQFLRYIKIVIENDDPIQISPRSLTLENYTMALFA